METPNVNVNVNLNANVNVNVNANLKIKKINIIYFFYRVLPFLAEKSGQQPKRPQINFPFFLTNFWKMKKTSRNAIFRLGSVISLLGGKFSILDPFSLV